VHPFVQYVHNAQNCYFAVLKSLRDMLPALPVRLRRVNCGGYSFGDEAGSNALSMFDGATKRSGRFSFGLFTPLANNCAVSLRNNQSFLKITNAVGQTVVMDLRVIDIIEAPEVVIRAENTAFDSEA